MHIWGSATPHISYFFASCFDVYNCMMCCSWNIDSHTYLFVVFIHVNVCTYIFEIPEKKIILSSQFDKDMKNIDRPYIDLTIDN